MPPEPQPQPTASREREVSPGRPAQPPSSSSAGRWAGGIVLALVLYVLSTGPAVKLTEAGIISDHTYELIYAPVIWPLNHTTMGETYLGPIYLWWILLWGARIH